MSAPGFYDYQVLLNGTTTSNSYTYSSIINTGKNNQMCVFISLSLGAGLTSAEYKFQQSLTNDPAGEWYDYPIVNYSTLTTSVDTPAEYYLTSKSFTQSLTAGAGQALKLGPFPIIVGMPFFRVGRKASGVGTLTDKLTITRIVV